MNRLQSRTLANKGFMVAAAFALVALVEHQLPNGAVATADTAKSATVQHILPYESRVVHGAQFLGRVDRDVKVQRAEKRQDFAETTRQPRWVF
ncbi:hypothetical protein [Pseudomonas matsuisoli]|uniref:Secreted protein n=1 Tax=Pseudomonas matsuisoli TaxID=1515666 RepID=A0A917UYC5_9PSED|nr:hypothetical protein [Pseudomonas matsuisoli]GGJ96051.1 hypothetical protein GCM10009304_22470 [Pseudomonas matsuisoli]